MSDMETQPLGGADGTTSSGNETGAAMSMMGGVVRPEGLPEAEEFGIIEKSKARGKFFNQGTLLIVVVFIIAAATLYGMRISQRDEGASAQAKTAEAKVDQALAKLAGSTDGGTSSIESIFQDTDKIVSMFSVDLTEHQVPVRYIKKNPFVLPVFHSVRTDHDDAQAVSAMSTKAERRRAQELRQELGGLVLQSVMQGVRPVAIISGDLVQPGQQIGSFTVRAINSLSVELVGDEGRVFKLVMEDGSGSNGRGSGGFRR
jgi:hypothetical protein